MDLLLHRYHDIDFILKLSMDEGLKLLNKAIEKESDQKIWERWLTVYPHMEMKSLKFKSFNEYKQELLKPKVVSTKTKDEIYKKAEEIKKSDLANGRR